MADCCCGRIDNNEMAGQVDGAATYRGELPMYSAEVGSSRVSDNVERRMGWTEGEIQIGTVGKAIQTMGMARVSTSSAPIARRRGWILLRTLTGHVRSSTRRSTH